MVIRIMTAARSGMPPAITITYTHSHHSIHRRRFTNIEHTDTKKNQLDGARRPKRNACPTTSGPKIILAKDDSAIINNIIIGGSGTRKAGIVHIIDISKNSLIAIRENRSWGLNLSSNSKIETNKAGTLQKTPKI